jgi:hypothetical protein
MNMFKGIFMKEHAIQNAIRNSLVDRGLFFRVNVGQAWTGDEVKKLPDGSVLITNARPFNTGLPKGFSDLFGLTPLTIQPEHVGQQVGVFTAIEVKTQRGRVSEQQGNFLRAVNDNGGLAGVARSPDDAMQITKGHDLVGGNG